MIPQTGDIWKYRHPQRDWDDSIVLLYEELRWGPGFFGGQNETVFWCYDLLNDQYDEYIFNDSNMKHWEKLA